MRRGQEVRRGQDHGQVALRQVSLPGGEGKMGSLFDALEDMDIEDCLARATEIGQAQA